MSHAIERPAEVSKTFTIGGDLNVNRLGLGAMHITDEGGPKDKQAALALLHRALELGINLLDTADSYGPETSEKLIAEMLYPYPKDLVIATKGGLLRSGPGQRHPDWYPDGRPEHLREALEGSLRRLRLNCIDLYQFHRPDPTVPFEASVGELARLREEGKIRHIGLSNVTAQQLAQAQRIVPIVTVQNRYNLATRQSRNMTVAESEEMIDICARQGIGFIPWEPLAKDNFFQEGDPLVLIARRHNATPYQIALAWLLKRSSNVLPIPGTSSVKHLEENALSLMIQLTQEEFELIDSSSMSHL
ncbi:aldo/keto reductase [Ktedonosporobacter rubrisoli]|uniref:Aldo/keto reductase n=1 Tax=Ktedonosporobacter rubrisoli TaxID=2509675 RepID=A0A4P6JXD9_KTERU|nr:aldo/keto reductase [Ktedonosporobacter rubrisoli]QBD79686.1 aldo/keto reductase [Ktedonosporobacter rubrisoli]